MNLGNAVPVLFAKNIGEAVIEVLNKKEKDENEHE